MIDAVVDPNVSPLPPHITLDHAKSMTAALLKGDPDAVAIAKQSAMQKLREVLPGR